MQHGKGSFGLLRAKSLIFYDSNMFQYTIAFFIIFGFVLDIVDSQV